MSSSRLTPAQTAKKRRFLAHHSLPQRRSALRLKGTAGHWRPFRYRAWLRRTAARVRQPRERAMARFSPFDEGRMTKPAANRAVANWDSNTDLLYLAKF
jgi:hypothetical protein